MELNFIGLAAALTTFFSIWAGHVLVRLIEHRSVSITLPAACFATLGTFLLIGTFLSTSPILSTILGILSITTLWDAYEFPRQQRRVIKGHAPANPANPRHVRILKEHKTATTLDLLKREPMGYAVEGCHPERSEGSLLSNIRDSSVAKGAPSERHIIQ